MLSDFQLEELLAYRGDTFCPSDFDDYWSRALKEQQAVETNLILKPIHYTGSCAECSDIYFAGVRGARIHAKWMCPSGKHAGNRPALLIFPCYREPVGDWTHYLHFVSQGFCVAVMDVRGQSLETTDPAPVRGGTHRGSVWRGVDGGKQELLLRHTYLDAVQLFRIVQKMPGVDKKRIAVYGGSIALACAAMNPSVKRLALLHPLLADYRFAWKVGCGGLYEELSTYFRLFDPLHRRENQLFETLAYVDIQYLAPWVQATTEMYTGLQDTVSLPKGQFSVYNRITATKNLYIYPDYGHEYIADREDRVFQFLMQLEEDGG